MRRVRQKDTAAETGLRRVLFSRGLRYRLQVRVIKAPRRVADIAFTGPRVAVFVDGCFWHGCPEHATWPKNNAEFWREKILANRAPDADTDARLTAAGWRVVRVWTHEDPDDAARRVEAIVRARRLDREAA
jgi:DNA mismatch endonuclease (patch repair protein)